MAGPIPDTSLSEQELIQKTKSREPIVSPSRDNPFGPTNIGRQLGNIGDWLTSPIGKSSPFAFQGFPGQQESMIARAAGQDRMQSNEDPRVLARRQSLEEGTQTLEDPAVVAERVHLAASEDLKSQPASFEFFGRDLDPSELMSRDLSYQETTEPTEEPPTDPIVERMAAQLMKASPGMTYEEALAAVGTIYSVDGGQKTTPGGKTTGKKLLDDLMKSETANFGATLKDGKTTAQHISGLFDEFGVASDDLKKEASLYTDSLKKLRTGENNYFHAKAAKEYDVQLKQANLDRKKLSVERKSEKHYKSLNEYYFGKEGETKKGLYYRMQDVVDQTVTNLQKTSNLGRHLFDFSAEDKDSFLGVNWKKTALAVAGLAAMGGQIGLSIGVKGLPNFIGPLIAKAIDADISSQKAAASEARLKAAGVGNLFKDLMAGYGNVVQAIEHATVGGYQVALALLAQAKNMPLTTDARKGIMQIEEQLKMEANQKAIGVHKVTIDIIKDEVALAVDGEMKSQQLQNLETQEDATKVNGYIALMGHENKLAGKVTKLTADQVKKVDGGFDAINGIREIKRQASDLFKEELGDVERLFEMTVGEFRQQFADNDSVSNKLNKIVRSAQRLAYSLARASDPRVSNMDFETWLKISGTPEKESLFSFITNIYNTEYAVKEATLSRLTGIHGTAAFEKYEIPMRLAFGQESDEIMENFISSAMQREKASRVAPGASARAEQHEAALQRLNVGIVPVRAVKYPDLEKVLFTGWAGSPVSNKEPLPEVTVTKQTPAQRREDYAAIVSPVDGEVVITSMQGPRTAPTAGATTNHGGLDIAGKLGDTVRSITDGKVYKVKDSNTGYGKHIIVQDLNGNLHTYAHGSKLGFFEVGDVISAGDKIMEIGQTGTTTAVHLHYDVKKSNGRPLPAIAFLGAGKIPWITKAEKAEAAKTKR